MEYKDLRFQIKSLNDVGEFEGYAAYKGNTDAYNDVIEHGAFKRTIRNKKQFPILFMHDPMQPIGLSTLLKEDERGLFTRGKLDVEGNEIARRVYSGLRNGYIDSMSIGFTIPKGGDEIDRTGKRRLKEIKLLEYSLITKGFAANELALVSGFKSTHDYNSLLSRIEHLEKQKNIEEDDPPVDMDLINRIADLEEEVKYLKELLADSSEDTRPFLMSSDSDESTLEIKSVIGSSDLPVVKGEWDASSAEKRIWEWAGDDLSKVKRAYFWVDGDPKNKGSYKLPFADVRDGKLVAVSNALSAVKGALNGARGGVKGISDDDKKRIMSKVEAYEKRLGDEKPKMDAELLNQLQELNKFLRGE